MTDYDDHCYQLYQEAENLKDSGKLEESLAKLTELLGHREDFVLAHLTCGVLLGRLGRHEEAVRHVERACELDPQDPFNFTAMSVTYQRAFQGTGDHGYIQKAEDAMARAHMLQAGG